MAATKEAITMANLAGKDVRKQDRENNSEEQERKIRKGQDIEPQAENWEDKRGSNADSPNISR